MPKSFEECTPEELANDPLCLLAALAECYRRGQERKKSGNPIIRKLRQHRRIDELAQSSGAERAC